VASESGHEVEARPSGAIRNLRELLASNVVNRRRPRTDPLLPRGVEHVLVRLFGRPIRCAECGRVLFRGFPIAWRGEVWLIGAYDRIVRVTFSSSETMEFRHVRLDECAAPERPWVR
jgi:hypothetical protein